MRSTPRPIPTDTIVPSRPARTRSWLLACLCSASGCTLDMQGVANMPEEASDPSRVDSGDQSSGSEESEDDAPSEPEAMRAPRDARAPTADVDASTRTDGGTSFLDAAMMVPTPPARDGAASDARSETRTDAKVDAGNSEARCDLEGTFALRTEVSIAWEGWAIVGIPILSAGEGTFTMDAISVVSEADKQVEVRPCAVSIPDFETERNSSISELYGVHVPDEAWEKPSIPRWRASWGASCYQPGCTMFTGTISAVIGARVTGDPFSWPPPGASSPSFRVSDDDDDGLPGLTFVARGPTEMNAAGRAYAYPPLAPSLFARARLIQMAVAMRTQIEGKLETCDRASGGLSVMALHSRALGCSGQRGEDAVVCSQEQVRFLDQNMPAWTVRSGRYQSVRIDPNATCAMAREALPKRPAQRESSAM